jgi:exonuclease III
VTLRVATWNVNSLDVRLPRLPDWLGANAPTSFACAQAPATVRSRTGGRRLELRRTPIA